jgi:hypothetical protein
MTAEVGDARRLTQADASVDAVLILGPLYRLVGRAERLLALIEHVPVIVSHTRAAAEPMLGRGSVCETRLLALSGCIENQPRSCQAYGKPERRYKVH